MSLVVKGLNVSLGDRPILRKLGFEGRRGELLALIGPNGAGKTTCLRALLGLIPSVADVLEAAGTPLAKLSLTERARLMAYIPQSRHVAWPLSVQGLVGLGRHPHRESARKSSAHVAKAIESVGLEALANRNVQSLSGGELALALLARALAVEAPMLLADEPVASLDLAHQIVVMERLRAIAGAGSCVLVVLHDLSLAARFCDRLLLLDQGRIAIEGSPAQVIADPALEIAYRVRLRRGLVAGVPIALAVSDGGVRDLPAPPARAGQA